WLAERRDPKGPTGPAAHGAGLHASALLPIGVSVSLGAFGTDTRKALHTLGLQQLIPALSGLSVGEDARHCAQWRSWPARYRLDALQPAPGRTVNLAHLLLGHGGDLAWLEWVVIDKIGRASCRERAEAWWAAQRGA